MRSWHWIKTELAHFTETFNQDMQQIWKFNTRYPPRKQVANMVEAVNCICHYCGQQGHKKPDCPIRRTNLEAKRQPRRIHSGGGLDSTHFLENMDYDSAFTTEVCDTQNTTTNICDVWFNVNITTVLPIWRRPTWPMWQRCRPSKAWDTLLLRGCNIWLRRDSGRGLMHSNQWTPLGSSSLSLLCIGQPTVHWSRPSDLASQSLLLYPIKLEAYSSLMFKVPSRWSCWREVFTRSVSLRRTHACSGWLWHRLRRWMECWISGWRKAFRGWGSQRVQASNGQRGV